MPGMQEFEKLGVFYLGRMRDATGAARDDLLLYDSRDLVTHGVIVGMTGSGKTGLAISLLEEAAIDGVPAIAVDPKGDLGNLLLGFPDLRPEDFAPWIDEGEAQRAGMDPGPYAAKVAEGWKKGLASWGQDGARIRRYLDAVDLAIYTPGASAGLPLSILRSLSPPAGEGDADAVRERATGAVSAILGLLGIEADPLRSREHILLSRLVDTAWSAEKPVDLGGLVRQIQQPPFDRVGVLDVESFFPAKERAGLASALNNLLASPGFAAWTEGEPLDVGCLLRTPEGRPRLSVVSVAHLGEAERMFFVTLLLNEVLAWTRAQSGTSSLRALLYMDEVFGYFPPVANPPSKGPMLSLLKQARAFGVGVVLATQNPVDLDYKGLSNAGTWFLGRLQTERDKARVLDGLEGASATAGKAFDRPGVDRILSGLEKRVFLLNNVHADAPALFESRWALSYLRGPMTKAQIQKLMADRRKPANAPAAAPAPAAAADRPVLPPDVAERFLPPAGAASTGARLAYRPRLCGVAKLHYVDAKAGIDAWETVALLAVIADDGSGGAWDEAEAIGSGKPDFESAPRPGAAFDDLPAEAARAKSYAAWKKSFADFLYRARSLTLLRCDDLGLASKPGESEGEFRARVQHAIREKRDADVDALRKKYDAKLQALAEKERRAQERMERESTQATAQTVQAAISVGATVLGALFGRKAISTATLGRATTAARGIGRVARDRQDVDTASAGLEAVRQERTDLEAELKAETDELAAAPEPAVERTNVKPRKSDVGVEAFVLAWAPYRLDADGGETAAWR